MCVCFFCFLLVTLIFSTINNSAVSLCLNNLLSVLKFYLFKINLLLDIVFLGNCCLSTSSPKTAFGHLKEGRELMGSLGTHAVLQISRFPWQPPSPPNCSCPPVFAAEIGAAFLLSPNFTTRWSLVGVPGSSHSTLVPEPPELPGELHLTPALATPLQRLSCSMCLENCGNLGLSLHHGGSEHLRNASVWPSLYCLHYSIEVFVWCPQFSADVDFRSPKCK